MQFYINLLILFWNSSGRSAHMILFVFFNAYYHRSKRMRKGYAFMKMYFKFAAWIAVSFTRSCGRSYVTRDINHISRVRSFIGRDRTHVHGLFSLSFFSFLLCWQRYDVDTIAIVRPKLVSFAAANSRRQTIRFTFFSAGYTHPQVRPHVFKLKRVPTLLRPWPAC